MAALLPIDTTTGAWREVALYAHRRIEELSEECCGLETTDERRRACAARIAELRELLGAPAEAQRIGAMRADDNVRSY